VQTSWHTRGSVKRQPGDGGLLHLACNRGCRGFAPSPRPAALTLPPWAPQDLHTHRPRDFATNGSAGAAPLLPRLINPGTIDCFASLAMTQSTRICHCEERSDEAISSRTVGDIAKGSTKYRKTFTHGPRDCATNGSGGGAMRAERAGRGSGYATPMRLRPEADSRLPRPATSARRRA